MSYKITNQYGTPFGGFYPNDIPDVFMFSNNNYYSFSTKKEAEGFIKRIKRDVRKERSRYGKEFYSKHLKTAHNLKIVKR